MDIPRDEKHKVEQTMLDQLQALGWSVLAGDIDVPYLTERENFRQVLLPGRLNTALKRLNPWLDEDRRVQAANALERLGAVKLMEANQAATDLLLRGTLVEGEDGREQVVRYIDYDLPENNDFLALNQFRVDLPHRGFIVPDIVLFVNGIPLVVIECKSPATSNPLESAIDQLRRYSNQRGAEEGVEKLFHYNQFLVATVYYDAWAGTIGATPKHYLQWKDAYPYSRHQLPGMGDADEPSGQHFLTAGMLYPAHLLDIMRNFILFKQEGGKTIKVVARYQQFRAVQEAVRRLQHGKRGDAATLDERGGIIWHTQGSGKSLTMVFLVRKLRSILALRRFKVVVVTDRTDLEQQLSGTAALTGETVLRARNIQKLKDLLRADSPDLVFAMIQKYQNPDEDQPEQLEKFDKLNLSSDILVLVDEAHRSQGSELHANLLAALPNCARIGFTGTPILMGDRKKTHDIFGDFIDRYTLKEAEADGAIVPIFYEGRTAEGAVADGSSLDSLFENMFREDYTEEEMEAIKAKYATSGDVLEAPKLIAAKAADMLRHYVDTVMPNGFKAQVVAISRLAAIRYQAAFVEAQRDLVDALEALDPALLTLAPEELEACDPETQFLVRAYPHLNTLRRMEFAAIISGKHNDKEIYHPWSDAQQKEVRIERFKKPLTHPDPQKQDGLTFLIVKSMLLTGFDAPIEQALYLDRGLRGHELLQAIARVNRTYSNKTCGLVVDYYGVARHLKEALAVYADEDIQGVQVNISEEVERLAARHRRLLKFFEDRGLDIYDEDGCIYFLETPKMRAQFLVGFKLFLESLDTVMPRPQALKYLKDARQLGFISKTAANLYRDHQLNINDEDVGKKVRALIDQHIISLGIDPTIPPISIMDANFEDAVSRHVSVRTKASEMEHAARHHISVNFQQDPAYYRALSERLAAILQSFQDNWAELVEALRAFTEEVRKGRQQDSSGLDPRTQAPFLGILVEEAGSHSTLTKLAEVTIELVDHVRQDIRKVDFWRNRQAQRVLRGWIFEYLYNKDAVPYERLDTTADRLIELAKANHVQLTT